MSCATPSGFGELLIRILSPRPPSTITLWKNVPVLYQYIIWIHRHTKTSIKLHSQMIYEVRNTTIRICIRTISSNRETHGLWWSNHFELITIRGLAYGLWICLRKQWKYCAGVEGATTIRLYFLSLFVCNHEFINLNLSINKEKCE